MPRPRPTTALFVQSVVSLGNDLVFMGYENETGLHCTNTAGVKSYLLQAHEGNFIWTPLFGWHQTIVRHSKFACIKINETIAQRLMDDFELEESVDDFELEESVDDFEPEESD